MGRHKNPPFKTEEANNALEKAIADVREQEEKIYRRFNERALDAADNAIDAMRFVPKDELELKARRLQLDASTEVLSYVVTKKRPEEKRSDVTINIMPNQVNNVLMAQQLLGSV